MNSLKKYLSQFSSICWYMAAGVDFREMMYLSKEYSKHLGWDEIVFPDCFLLTDAMGEFYFDRCGLCNILKENGVLFEDPDTRIVAKNGQELKPLILPGYREGILAPDSFFGRVFTADIEIDSSVLGHISTKLAYAVTENTAFMFDVLLKDRIKIDYIVHVRYGMGNSNGMFVKAYLKELGTRYFISDWNLPFDSDFRVMELYSDRFAGHEDARLYDTGLFVPSYRWSYNGDVHWYKVLIGY